MVRFDEGDLGQSYLLLSSDEDDDKLVCDMTSRERNEQIFVMILRLICLMILMTLMTHEIHEVIAWFLKFLVVKFLLGED